ncbi:arginase family protein [Wolbachia endosymbiont (group A) of Myopa testacea]|uniref:arginase family protein n=1 Tax=Wolbachia endosymbiont (group A) of Myopa testacea TaxID=3066148 RepID=UPI0033416CB9
MWESGGNDRLDHGIFMYNLIKKNIVNPKKLIQVGIRTFIEDGLGSNVLDMEWINQNGIEKVVSEIKSIVGNNPVYLTFDIDCLDPSYAPGTGTPVVGGLSSFQALSIIRKLKGINFIGMDIVEVCPPYDIADITALVAATISLEYLSLRASYLQA